MRINKHKPVMPDAPKNGIKIENSDAIAKVSDALTGSVIEDIDSGNLDSVEGAGKLAMSILLTQCSNGLLNDTQRFAFLKELASKKTQAPVQRIEQHTKIDLTAVFASITNDNVPIRESSLDKAKVWDGEVRERLQLDDDMMLKPRDEDLAEGSEPTFTPTPPPEIEDIRTGGDGSEKRQRWAKSGAKIPDYRRKDNG